MQGMDLALAISRHLMGGPGKRAGGPIQSDLDGGLYRDHAERARVLRRFHPGIHRASPLRPGCLCAPGASRSKASAPAMRSTRSTTPNLGKWVLVDPFHSLYFIDPDLREPLSVLEVHDRLLIDRRRVAPDRNPAHRRRTAAFPVRGDWRSNITGAACRSSPWRGATMCSTTTSRRRFAGAPRVSRHLERAVAICVGQYPSLRIYPIGVSHRDVDSLFRARDRFVLAIGRWCARKRRFRLAAHRDMAATGGTLDVTA